MRPAAGMGASRLAWQSLWLRYSADGAWRSPSAWCGSAERCYLAVVVVRPGPYPVPTEWLLHPDYHRNVRQKRIVMAVVGLALIPATDIAEQVVVSGQNASRRLPTLSAAAEKKGTPLF